jgi:riboflavin synthase
MKIGIADTMFSRVDMAKFALDILKNSKGYGREEYAVERYTVPGVKDLPVACKKLFEEFGCDIVLALGMPGPEKIDKICSHEASAAIQQVQLMVNKHILEVFVHMDEAKNDTELYEIAKDRTMKHTVNAMALLHGKEALQKFAGKGKRQGHNDIGEVIIR